MKTIPTPQALRAHYAKTALARMGIPFERGMQIEGVRIVVEGAAEIETKQLDSAAVEQRANRARDRPSRLTNAADSAPIECLVRRI